MQSLCADNPEDTAQLNALLEAHTDVTGAALVNIQVRDNRVWINVNGVCLLRVCQAQNITVDAPKRRALKDKGKGSFTEVDMS